MNKEQEETIARKITGCNTFKNCSYEVFCHGLDLAFQLGQIQGQKEGCKETLIDEIRVLERIRRFLTSTEDTLRDAIDKRLLELKDKLKKLK
jgi:hypothetical protein